MNIGDYGIILPIGVPSHMYGIFTIQNHDIVLGKVEIGLPISVLSFSYKLYVRKHVLDTIPHNTPHFDKSNLVVGENVLNVLLMYGPIRNHPLIQNIVANETQETNLGNQYVDKDVPYILSDILKT